MRLFVLVGGLDCEFGHVSGNWVVVLGCKVDLMAVLRCKAADDKEEPLASRVITSKDSSKLKFKTFFLKIHDRVRIPAFCSVSVIPEHLFAHFPIKTR